MRKIKKLTSMLLSGMLAFSMLLGIGGSLTVNAAGVRTIETVSGIADFGEGAAKITVKGNEGQSLVGKKFNVYKLFNAENSVGNESINYTFNPLYESAIKKTVANDMTANGSEILAKDVTEYMAIDYINNTYNTHRVEGALTHQEIESRTTGYRVFVEKLRDEIKKQHIDAPVVHVADVKPDNSVDIANLSYGYYIVDEVTDVKGQHSAASLCMVDTANPDSNIDIKSDYPTVTKKIKEDDAYSNEANNRWNDIGDYEIGQTVPYQYTSVIPNINGYDKYYYAWHDKMDAALTFNKDSVQIIIDGMRSGVPASYTLQSSEFDVNLAVGDETFVVVINDIKAIIDREFNNKNSTGDNIYGQKVTVTYNATLNDNAAKKTGRPGFENDVRLEFSNDPDTDVDSSTGFTPWDTVVCFTYQVDVLKTNDHDLNLANAHFRLYSDDECKNEVYVKKTTDGYNVINRDSVGGTDHTGGTVPEESIEMISKADGTIVIFGLDSGKYYLKETKAPEGYRLLKDPIEITLKATFTDRRDDYTKGASATSDILNKFDASAHIKTFYDGIFTTKDDVLATDVASGTANITVINKVGVKLPVTGTPALMLITIGGVALMAAGIAFTKKKGKNNKI